MAFLVNSLVPLRTGDWSMTLVPGGEGYPLFIQLATAPWVEKFLQYLGIDDSIMKIDYS